MTIMLFILLLVLSSIACAFNSQILHVHNKFSSLQQVRCAPTKMTSNDSESPTNNDNERDDGLKIRYLGSGEDAIVRPGVVLVAPKHEYDHFLMRSAVFVYAIGLNEDDDLIIRAVVLDNPTAFTIGEMSPQIMGSLSDNILFRGGYDGQDSAMLLHSAGGSNGPVKSDSEIGSSGIYEGGIVSAMESVDAGLISQDQCKFFFNYMVSLLCIILYISDMHTFCMHAQVAHDPPSIM